MREGNFNRVEKGLGVRSQELVSGEVIAHAKSAKFAKSDVESQKSGTDFFNAEKQSSREAEKRLALSAKGAKPWPMVRLGDVCEINLGKTPPRGNRNCWDKDKLSGFVWVSIADMATLVDGKVLDSKEYITKYAIEEFGVPVVEKGTLLLSFKLTLGRVAIAGQNLYTNEAIAALPIKKEYVSKVYLPYLKLYFSFFDWLGFAERDEKVLGKTLNKKKLAEVPLLIPSLSVQKEIVKRLEKELGEADKVAAEFNRITETLLNLRKAILSEAFE